MALKRFVPHRGGLVVTFGVSALVATVIVGLAMRHFAATTVRERAVDDAHQAAQQLTFQIQSEVSADPRFHQDPRRSLKRIVRKALAAGYGPTSPTQVSIAGPVNISVSAPRAPHTQHVLTFRVPVRLSRGAGGIGIVDASVPYDRVMASAGTALTRLDLTLAGCLGLLYLASLLLAHRAAAKIANELVEREHRARRDPLTSLPTREQLHDMVHAAIVDSKRKKQKVALMLMDLNRFKEINDTLGHHTGDRVLQQLASRLRKVLRDSETVARLGGDEFAILLPSVTDKGQVTAVAQRILKSLEEPFVAAGLALDVDASIGIALYPDHGDRVAKLLRAADVAMYLGKESLSGYTFFTHGNDPGEDGGKRLALIGELRSALESGQLVLYYQPKIELATGLVKGVEALVRWEHPRGGLLAPDEFIPLLEQSSLLRRFTLYIVETALHDCSGWRRAGFDVTVAVNLSMRNLLDSQLPGDLRKLIHKSPNLKSDALELEITESMIMSDPERIFRVCMALRDLGFLLTVDDFGTGYSSLAYLHRLPVSSLKIDKSFIGAMGADNPDSEIIVRSTLDLAHNLGLAVVAEGVETPQVYDTLASLGCGHAQGYFISRPMPNEALVEWLGQHQPAATQLPDPGPPAAPALSPVRA
ncbi:MAG TPA: EAL domain-containing protein [Thermoleophilaceae bacterium]